MRLFAAAPFRQFFDFIYFSTGTCLSDSKQPSSTNNYRYSTQKSKVDHQAVSSDRNLGAKQTKLHPEMQAEILI